MNKTQADELKPCPFCGGACAVTKGYCTNELPWSDAGGDFYRVYCSRCQSRQLFHQTEAEAIEAWNSRAAIDALSAGEAAEAVGETTAMPGTSGFTMACFKAADVPVGAKLYLAAPTPAPQAEPVAKAFSEKSVRNASFLAFTTWAAGQGYDTAHTFDIDRSKWFCAELQVRIERGRQ